MRRAMRRRDDVIDHVRTVMLKSGRRRVSRGIDEGQVELLGGFNPIPPGSDGGWIVRVTSSRGTRWFVAVIGTVGFPVRMLDRVPWKHWMGGGSTLYNGDHPEDYAKLRDVAERIHDRIGG